MMCSGFAVSPWNNMGPSSSSEMASPGGSWVLVADKVKALGPRLLGVEHRERSRAGASCSEALWGSAGDGAVASEFG